MKKATFTTKIIAVDAVFMALTVILSMSVFSIPVPGGHLYLCDVVISLASLVLDPITAYILGGIGTFLGDMLFYPAPMFVSLVTHGIQAVIISLFSYLAKRKGLKLFDILGLSIGAIVMVAGYTFGRAFVYADMKTSLIKLPFEIVQAVFGAAVGFVLYKILSKRKVFIDVEWGKLSPKKYDDKYEREQEKQVDKTENE